MSHRNIAIRSESPGPADLKMSMKCRTTAGSLPPLVAGEEKQTSYVAAALQPLIAVFAPVPAGTAVPRSGVGRRDRRGRGARGAGRAQGARGALLLDTARGAGGGDHEDQGHECGGSETQRMQPSVSSGRIPAPDSCVGDSAAAASRASALWATAGSVVVHMGGRLALRKRP